MLVNVCLLHYNNYLNRRVKKSDKLADYLTSITNEIVTSINFNPGDGVTTKLVLNTCDDRADYLLVVSDDVNIESRWFIIESRRLRNGQYSLSLRRDLLVDFAREVEEAVSFIEKGWVNFDNPLIFNNENLRFNEIKKLEAPLYDDTKTAWVVTYLAPTVSGVVNIGVNIDPAYIPELSPATFPWYDLIDEDIHGPIDESQTYWVTDIGEMAILDLFQEYYEIKKYFNGKYTYKFHNKSIYVSLAYQQKIHITETHYTNNPAPYLGRDLRVIARDFGEYTDLDHQIFIRAFAQHLQSQDNFNALLAENGKIYKRQDKYYKIKTEILSEEQDYRVPDEGDPQDSIVRYYERFCDYFNNISNVLYGGKYHIELGYNTVGKRIKFHLKSTLVHLSLEEVSNMDTAYQLKLGQDEDVKPQGLSDAPYLMLAFPYGGRLNIASANNTVTDFAAFDRNMVLEIASSITKSLQPQSSGGFVYDIQLLPYCPVRDMLTVVTDADGNVSDLVVKSGYAEHRDYEYITTKPTGTETPVNKGLVLFAKRSLFSTMIPYQIDVSNPDSYDYKVEQQTTKWRISSPNYANYFEFDPWMNKGVSYFQVRCTYKPINPYIKINPLFSGLYGADFNDARGLICSGDFSLPQLSNAWESYQIQNKNYAAIFERGTEHLQIEYSNKQTRDALAGAIQVGAKGAEAIIHGATGDFAKAAIGTSNAMASAQTTALNLMYAKAEFTEQMAYRRDMYNFDLANIQARPSGLVKTSPFNSSFKEVPFLEKYTSTETEKILFKDKLIYNGMTVSAVGNIGSFIQPGDHWTFVVAHIIRIDIEEDSHLAQEIANELIAGVFFKGD